MSDIRHVAEETERKALRSLYEVAPPSVRDDLGFVQEEVGAALLSAAPGGGGIIVNRTLGLGLDAPATRETVAALRDRYAALGVGRYFVHRHDDARPAALPDWLADAGFRPHRRWMKFARGRSAPPEARTDLRVARIGRDHAGAFGAILSACFDMGPQCAPLLAALVDHPDWRVYMSFDGDRPVGAGALMIADGVAWLDWGGTDPAYRRRGSQSALMARRLADARDAGCTLMLTETGEAVPGDPQHSYANILRAGFREDYLRENWVPA